jgi:uncharacterized membrane protein
MDQNPNDAGYTQVPPVTPPYPPPATPPYPPQPTAGGLSDNSVAALCYLTFIPAIIFLVIEPYNKSKFVRFNAIQCISFSVVAFALHLVLMFIPIIGWLISLALSLVFLVLWILCIMKASKGEWYKLPIIGDFALKQANS